MAYTREQILGMEKGILNKLEWNLTVPTSYVFLVRFLKAASCDTEVRLRGGATMDIPIETVHDAV